MSNNGMFPFNNEKFDNFYDRMDNLVRGSVNSAKNFLSDTFRIDIQEDDEKYTIEAEVPGIEKENLTVTVDEGNLVITAISSEKTEEEKIGYIHKERRYGKMRRELYLKDADSESTNARMKDGVLYITVKKAIKEDTSQEIPID